MAASPDGLRDPERSLFLAFTRAELLAVLAVEPQPDRPVFSPTSEEEEAADEAVAAREEREEGGLVALMPVTFSQGEVVQVFETVRKTSWSKSRDVLWLRTLLLLLIRYRFSSSNHAPTVLERDLKTILVARRQLSYLRHQRLVNVAANYRRSTDEAPISYEFTIGWGLGRRPLSPVYSTTQHAA